MNQPLIVFARLDLVVSQFPNEVSELDWERSRSVRKPHMPIVPRDVVGIGSAFGQSQ